MVLLRRIAVFTIGVVLVLSWMPGHAAGTAKLEEHVPGEVLVKFRTDTRARDVDRVFAVLGARSLARLKSGAQRVVLGSGWTTERAIALFRGDPAVEYVEPNYIYTLHESPDDPRYPELWGLNNTGQTGGTPGADIDAERAWNITTGSPDVLVAVIDSGIDLASMELRSRLWINPADPVNGLDDDGNGYIDDFRGWDFVESDNSPSDDYFHGTHVAGTIGAMANNRYGVAGVCWNVTMVNLKCFNEIGRGNAYDLADAIEYAVDIGADIINASWGSSGAASPIHDAIVLADQAGILFVASAGNASSNTDISPQYPASWEFPSIISVAATNHNDVLGWFSNYGAESVDLGAPGVDVLSTIPYGQFRVASGTSMAAPHVAGAAALLLSIAPDLQATDLKAILLANVDPVEDLAGETVTGGRLNAFYPLREPDTSPPGTISDLSAGDPNTNTLTVGWTATGDDGSTGIASDYDLRYSSVPIVDEATFEAATSVPLQDPPQPAGSPEEVEVTGLDALTTYHFAVRSLDEWGNAGPLSNGASATTLHEPTFYSDPPSFSVQLHAGGMTIRSLLLENRGLGTLDWRIPPPDASTVPEWIREGNGVPSAPADCPDDCPPVTTASYRVPLIPYSHLDSNGPGEVTFHWDDIALTGTVIEELVGDNQVSEPIPLGFDMPFYGDYFSHVHVSTDGWLALWNPGLDNPSPNSSNWPLPTPEGRSPSNLVAAFWDDLDFEGAQRAVYSADGESFTVQYTDVPRFNGPGAYTFQVTLASSGDITVRYLSMSGKVTRATVGIQNGAWTEALQVSHHDYYVRDNLAVLVTPSVRWLSLSEVEGRLHAGESTRVFLTFDASEIEAGLYQGDLFVVTNDTSQPVVSHPLYLDVSDMPRLILSYDGVREGDTLDLESCRTFNWTRTSSHDLPGTFPAAGGGTLNLLVRGHFAGLDHTATLLAEGLNLGTATGPPPGQVSFVCQCRTVEIPLDSGTLDFLLLDDHVQADVWNSQAVDWSRCPINRHTVKLRYEPSFNEIDFGIVSLGQSATRSVVLENTGGQVLVVEDIASDSSEFVPSPGNMILTPGESAVLTIDFDPAGGGGNREAAITFRTNDPGRSTETLVLTAFAAEPGVLVVDPRKITAAVTQGDSAAEPLVLWNGTTDAVPFEVEIEYAGAENWLMVNPVEGALDPSTGKVLGVLFTSVNVPPGTYAATLEITFNGPDPEIFVPVVLTVVERPGGKLNLP